MKKGIALTATVLLLCVKVWSQQLPLYSQLYFMRMLYNPALTAYNGSSDVYGFYREQWTSIPGHPVTAGGVGELSLWKDRIGTGIHVYSDRTDIIHRTSAQLYYAQKITLAKDHLLSLGFSAGIYEAHIDYNNAIITDPDDQHILPAGKSAVAFDLNVGLAYQWKKLTIGFSIPQIVNTKASILNQVQSTELANKRHFIGSVSYEFSFKKETWNVEPSILVKNGSGKPVQLDANVMANYKRMLYLGLGYRTSYGLGVQAAVRIAQTVTIGYAYEFPIMNGINYSDTRGTHEIIFGVHFDKWMKKGKEAEPKLDLIDSLMTQQAQLRKDADSLRHDVDSVFKMLDTVQKQQTVQKQKIDSTEQKVWENEQKMSERDQQINDLKHRVDSVTHMVQDSLDNLVKEYKKHVSEKPAVNFPDKVDVNTKAKVGDVYRLNKVEFNTNSSYLKKESFGELDKVVDFLKMNPNAHIRISGHTDYTASEEYNQWLSDRRAKRVYDYLTEKGVAANRLEYIGFGRKAPIATNDTEDGRALNRRVEMEVTK